MLEIQDVDTMHFRVLLFFVVLIISHRFASNSSSLLNLLLYCYILIFRPPSHQIIKLPSLSHSPSSNQKALVQSHHPLFSPCSRRLRFPRGRQSRIPCFLLYCRLDVGGWCGRFVRWRGTIRRGGDVGQDDAELGDGEVGGGDMGL